MVNPLGPGDPDPISSIPSVTSQEASGVEGSSTEGVSKTGETESPSSSTVGEWSFLQAAKNALSDFINKLTGSTPVTPTDPPTPTFDDYRIQAETDLNTFLTSADYTAVQAAYADLQEAITQMNALASGSEQEAIAAEWTEKNTKIIEVNTQLTKLDALATETETFANSVATMATIELVNAALVKSEENVEEAKTLLEKIQTDNLLGSVPASAQGLVDKTEAEAADTKVVTDVIIAAYNAGEFGYGSVQIAKENNSQTNIDAAKVALAEAKAALEAAISQYPDSPVLRDELTRVENAEVELQTIEPAEAPSGGDSASVGTSQQRVFTAGNVRIALLLDDAESESVSIILEAFREMIELFQEGDFGAGETDGPVQGEAGVQGPTPEGAEAQEMLDATEKALGSAKTREGLLNAMGQITSQAFTTSGTPQPVANKIGGSVKQLYSSASSSKKDAKSLSSGYDAYKQLTESLRQGSSRSKDTLNAASRSALSQPVPRSDARPRETDDASMRVAKMVADGSRDLNDVFSRLAAVESLATILEANPNSGVEELKQKLTAETSKPPKLGYPDVQLPSEATQKFLSRLATEFVEGSQRDAERDMLSFDVRTQFIQQVLVNLGSLFSAYLQ